MDKIKALVTWVGEHNEHTTSFLNRINTHVERVYFLNTDSDGISTRTGKKVKYKKITMEYITQLKKQYPSIVFEEVIVNDPRDFLNIQEKIEDIVNLEREKMNETRQGIAIDFTGGTAIVSAAMLNAAHEFQYSAYFVRLDKGKAGAHEIVPVELTFDAARDLTKKQKKWLKLIAENEHDFDPNNLINNKKETVHRGWATRADLEQKLRNYLKSLPENENIDIKESAYRISQDVLDALGDEDKKMITREESYEELYEDDQGNIRKKIVKRPLYRLTRAGFVAYKKNRLNKVDLSTLY